MKRRQILIFLLLLIVSVGCDHAAKRIAQAALAGAPMLSVASDAVRFELTSNPGAFLSLGATLPDAIREPLLLGLVPICLILVCVMALRSGQTSTQALVGLGMLVGGGIGNWLDRLLNDGAVTDFVSLGVGPLRTGIFNLADVLIIVGIGLFVLAQPPRSDPDRADRAADGEERPA